MAKNRQIPESSLFLEMERITKKIRERFNALLKKHNADITFDQWLILKEIIINQGANQKMISDNLAKEVASVSRILSKLSARNLVTKKSNSNNMREFKLYISPDGYELMDRLEIAFEQEFKRIFSNIYEQELNLIKGILTRISDDLK